MWPGGVGLQISNSKGKFEGMHVYDPEPQHLGDWERY